jgi:translation initiation factor 2B subunit (eIF-2B alpha/beta/delta family)
MRQEVIDRMREIRDDNQSGASTLTKEACELISFFSQMSITCNENQLSQDLLEFANLLKKCQPHMAPIVSLSYRVLRLSEKEKDSAKILASLHSLSHHFKSILADSKIAICDSLFQIVKDGDCILTHSSSSSVREALIGLHARGRNFTVIATESRPNYEGRELAKSLAGGGIRSEIIADAAALKLLERCAFVIVGADSICEEYFINKIGTYSLALGAKEFFKEFYVLADTTKFLPSSMLPAEEKMYSPKEILDENYYFERTPLSLVSKVLTEMGAMTQKNITRHISGSFD